jgi:hypothetical protein
MSFQLNGTPVASGVVNRLESVMTILWASPFAVLDVQEPFGARAAALVDHHHRRLHELVLRHDALNQSRHLVCAAAGAGRDNELNGLCRFPGGSLDRYGRSKAEGKAQQVNSA